MHLRFYSYKERLKKEIFKGKLNKQKKTFHILNIRRLFRLAFMEKRKRKISENKSVYF